MAESLASLYIEFDTAELDRGDTALNRIKQTLESCGVKIRGYDVSVGGAGKATRRYGEETERASKATRKLGDDARQASLIMDKLKGILALFGLGMTAREILATADSMQSLNNQLKLVTGSERAMIETRRELLAIANRTYASLEATGDLYVKTARAVDQYGYSQQQVLKFVEATNNAMRVGGVGAREQAAALFQLSQALGSGRLQGDEFRSISEAAPIMLDIMAKHLGKTRAEIRALAADGALTGRVIVDAMSGAADALAKQAEGMRATVGQALTVLRNNWSDYINTVVNGSGSSTALAAAIELVANNLGTVVTVVGTLVGIGLVRWVLGATASFVVLVATTLLQANAARTAGIANLFNASAMSASGAASLLASGGTLTFAQSLMVLRGAAVSTSAALMPLIVAAAPVIAIGVALFAAGTALSALYDAAKGGSGSNAINDSFESILDKLGLIDKKTESVSTKLYELLHNSKGEFNIHAAVKLTFDISPLGWVKKAIKKMLGEDDEETPIGMINPETGKPYGVNRYVANAGQHQDALAALAATGKKLEDLDKGIASTTLKFREQAQTVGKTTTEIEVMRMEKQRDAAMLIHEQEVRQLHGKNEELIQATLSRTKAAYNADIDAARNAIQQFTNAAAAEKLQSSIASTAAQLEKQAQQLGLTTHEITLLELSSKRVELANIEGADAARKAAEADIEKAKKAINFIQSFERQKEIDAVLDKLGEQRDALGKSNSELLAMQMAAKGATDAEIAKAQAMQGVIDKYREQEQVMSTLADLDKQVAQLGMSDTQRQLDELRRKGASSEQLNHAQKQLESIETYRKASEEQRKTAERMGRSGDGMQSAADVIRDGAITFDQAAKRFGAATENPYANASDEYLNSGKADVRFGAAAEERRRREMNGIGFYGNASGVLALSPQEEASLRRLNPNSSVNAPSNSIQPIKAYQLTLVNEDGSQVEGKYITEDNFEQYLDATNRKKARGYSN